MNQSPHRCFHTSNGADKVSALLFYPGRNIPSSSFGPGELAEKIAGAEHSTSFASLKVKAFINCCTVTSPAGKLDRSHGGAGRIKGRHRHMCISVGGTSITLSLSKGGAQLSRLWTNEAESWKSRQLPFSTNSKLNVPRENRTFMLKNYWFFPTKRTWSFHEMRSDFRII